jgi:hypothetical protein
LAEQSVDRSSGEPQAIYGRDLDGPAAETAHNEHLRVLRNRRVVIGGTGKESLRALANLDEDFAQMARRDFGRDATEFADDIKSQIRHPSSSCVVPSYSVPKRAYRAMVWRTAQKDQRATDVPWTRWLFARWRFVRPMDYL